MRVDYTLPGLLPTPEPAPSALPPEKATFRSRLRRLAAPVGKSWRRLLKLDAASSAPQISPPPRPLTFERWEPADIRLRWRGLLDKHSARYQDPAASGLAPEEAKAAQRMLAVLWKYQQMEEALMARQLMETKG